MNKSPSLLRLATAALVFITWLLIAGAGLAQDSFKPGESVGKPEISADGKTETFKDKDGNVTEVREYFDKTRKKLRTKEVVKEYHKNGKKKTVEMTFYFKEEKVKAWGIPLGVEQTPYPDGEYDVETSEYDADGKPTGKPKKVHYKDNKKVKKEKPKGETSLTQPTETALFFHPHEVEVNVFAIAAFGNAQEDVTHERTVKETRTVTRTHTERQSILIDDPTIGDFRLVERDVEVSTKEKETFKRTVRETDHVGPFDDHAFGLGIDAKCFVTREIGVGAEMNWLEGDHNALTFLATATARFPLNRIPSVAPYVTGGLGVQCADTNRLVGFVGGGIMKRFSRSCGAFVEARYRFDGDQENVCELRTGISIAFGPGGDEPTHQTFPISDEDIPNGEAPSVPEKKTGTPLSPANALGGGGLVDDPDLQARIDTAKKAKARMERAEEDLKRAKAEYQKKQDAAWDAALKKDPDLKALSDQVTRLTQLQSHSLATAADKELIEAKLKKAKDKLDQTKARITKEWKESREGKDAGKALGKVETEANEAKSEYEKFKHDKHMNMESYLEEAPKEKVLEPKKP